ncbi:MAG: DUF4271 domain-containing protein, partial [Prevotella sp.]
ADVLARLPHNATPEQQDSAIQANFRPDTVRYGERPDTLHMPGTDIGTSIYEVTMPDIHDGGYVTPATKTYTADGSSNYGMAGDPVPYTVRNDDMITGLLMVSFILVVVALSNLYRLIVRNVKDILYVKQREETIITQTSSEVRFQFFLLVQACLQFAIFQYFYTMHFIGDTFVLASQYHLIGIYFAMYMAYYLCKGILYSVVNTVFFGSKKSMQWMQWFLFITAMGGVILFPVTLLQVYFDLQIQNVTFYLAIVLILVKMLSIYKGYFIFFNRAGGFIQIILYFCALEIVPAALFWGLLAITGNHLNINF